MKRSYKILASLLIPAVIIGITGCGTADGTSNETTTNNVATTVTTIDETTESETTTAQPVAEGWEMDKTSGTLEAFNEYFDVDMDNYKYPAENKGTITKITYYSTVAGADRNTYVYTPYGYSKDESYPVVYLIHGIGCDCEQWVSMSLQKILDNMIEKGELKPCVAVVPSVIPGTGLDPNTLSATNIKAFTDFSKEFTDDLEPYIFANYSVSQSREDTAVCGLSMGGMEALSIGFTLPDRFYYIGSFSAAPSLDTSILTAKDEYPYGLILLCSGDADGTVGDNPFNYHQTLTKNGIDHIWYQYPNGSHSPSVWKNGLVNFLSRIFK